MDIYFVIFITLVAAALGSVAQIFYKRALKGKVNGVHEALRLFADRNVITGIALYGLGLVIYLFALKEADLSLVFPVFASSFVFVSAISILVLGERPSTLRLAGIGVLVVGIILITLSA